MKSRIFCIAFFALFATGGAQTSLDRISESFRELNTTLDGLSKSAVIHAHDSFSVNEIFASVIRQYPSILAITEIGPDGMIHRLASATGARRKVKSVADEQWFAQLMATQQPYNGITRTSQSDVLMIRAWPLFEESTPGSRLAGILTANIDLRKFLLDALKNGSSPLMVLYQGIPLLSRNWDEAGDYAEGSVRLANDEELFVRYKSMAPSAGSADASASQPRPSEPAPAATLPDSSTAAQPGKGLAAPARKAASEAAAVIPKIPPRPASFFTDSILSTPDAPLSNHRTFTIVFIAAILAIVGGAIVGIAAVFRRSRRRRHRDTRSSIMATPGPTSAIVIEKDSNEGLEENLVPPGTESLAMEEITSADRETKALPAIRELIAESTKKLRDLDRETDPIQRDQILHDIQDILTLWVNGELRHLTERLDRIAESINESEKHIGKSSELQVLRYEIGRIIGEIETLGEKIPIV